MFVIALCKIFLHILVRREDMTYGEKEGNTSSPTSKTRFDLNALSHSLRKTSMAPYIGVKLGDIKSTSTK